MEIGRKPMSSWRYSRQKPKDAKPLPLFPLLSLLSLSSFSFFFLSLNSYGPRGLKSCPPLVWSIKEALGGIKTPPHLLNRHSFFFNFFKLPVDRMTNFPVFGKIQPTCTLFPSNALYNFYPFSSFY